LKIFQITESLEIGGAERVVAALANQLSSRHRVAVVCLKRAGALAATLQPAVRVMCLGKREGQDLVALLRLIRLLRNERPHVVHTHDWGVYLDVMFAAAIARIPVAVHTVHGRYMAGSPSAPARAKRRLRHLLERFAETRYGGVACVSDSLRAHVEEEVGIAVDRMITLPNGIDVKCESAARPHKGSNETRFVAVGRLAQVKNFPLMIRAFAAARSPALPMHLKIVGDGPERAVLEDLVQSLSLTEHVEFLGFRSDVEALLQDTDALLLSSSSEGIPMSILEAMSCARAVVSTDVGGVATLVEHGVTGLLAPSGDVEAFARALTAIASDRAAACEMGRAGRARVQQNFSIDAMVRGYERLYSRTTEPASEWSDHGDRGG
jgi:sugar transferase (PEP-CTERM/EpsH1 system associated)